MADPLLNLSTLIERKFIAIDEVRYDIRNPDELSVLASFELGERSKRIDELAGGAVPDRPDELDELVAASARAVLVDVPDELFAKLSGAQRMAVVDVFTGLLVRSKLGVAGAMAKVLGQLPIGAMPSPASNVSMAAGRTGGCRKRLLRWFGLI